MSEADAKAFDARISDLESRMDNVVEGALLLTDVVENIRTMVNNVVERTDLLRSGQKHLHTAVSTLAEVMLNRS